MKSDAKRSRASQSARAGSRNTSPSTKQNSQRTNKPPQRAKTKKENMDFDEDDEDDEVDLAETSRGSKSKKLDPRLLFVGAAAIGIVVVGCMLFMGSDTAEEEGEPTLDTAQQAVENAVEDVQPEVITDSEGNPVYDSEGNVIGKDAINPGYSTSVNNESDGSVPAQVFDADDFISDLNGVPISGSYNVESIDAVDDYVEYEIKRAIIDDGMEIYWAEIEYEGKKYRSQMSYTHASKFKQKGIAKAKLEVLNIVGGGKVISDIILELEE